MVDIEFYVVDGFVAVEEFGCVGRYLVCVFVCVREVRVFVFGKIYIGFGNGEVVQKNVDTTCRAVERKHHNSPPLFSTEIPPGQIRSHVTN